MANSKMFKWPIDNFSLIAARDNPNKILSSKDFTVGGATFYLKFYPTNNRTDFPGKDFSSLYLTPKDLNGKECVEVKWAFWLENNCGQQIRKFAFISKIGVVGLGYATFVHHNEIYTNKNSFVIDDFLFICCEVTLVESDDSRKLDEINSKLRAQLFSNHENNISDDFTIEVGGEAMLVSKSLLIATSTVFERMLSSEMAEVKDNTIKIEDASIETVKAFIKYLHIGKLDNLDIIARDLFILADKYDVQSLADRCADSLSKALTDKNIFDRLKLAFMHGNEKLRRIVLNYVTTHNKAGNFHHILKSKEWVNLCNENHNLAMEIMDAVFEQTYFLG